MTFALRAAFRDTPVADLHDVAGAHEARMALGELEAQDVMVLRDRRDRLARHDDRTLGDGDLEHAPRGGREHRALLHLLGDHVPVRTHGVQRPFSDVEKGPCGVELGLRIDAPLLKLKRAVVVRLRFVALRLLRLDAASMACC